MFDFALCRRSIEILSCLCPKFFAFGRLLASVDLNSLLRSTGFITIWASMLPLVVPQLVVLQVLLYRVRIDVTIWNPPIVFCTVVFPCD